MGCGCKGKDNSDKVKAGNIPSNDRLGENASEEYSADSYTNNNKKKKKK